MGYLDISEVAKRTGTPASALRYYEERGLVASIGRRGLKRVFDPDVLDRLALIALGRAAGFTLNEIGEMFATGKPQIDRRALADKADQIDAKIRKLQSMRDGLRHAAACKAPSHLECPKFKRLMGLAVSRQRRQPRGRRQRVRSGARR